MAESTSYETKLVLTADASDAKREIKDLSSVKVDPVQVPVETPTVTPKVETPEPVTPVVNTPAPVKATVTPPEPVTPVVNTPAPVQVPVETPTVTPKVETPKPIEAKAKKVVVEVSDEEAKKKIESLTADEDVKRIRVVTKSGKLAERTDGKELFEIEYRANVKDVRQKIEDLKADSRINVKVETPEPAKVKVVEPKPVKPKVETPKPVKVPVEQDPRRLKVNAEADTVRVPVEQPAAVKIKTVFDSSGLGRISNALRGIRELANRVMSALGLFGFVAGLVMSAVAAFNWLKDKIHETERNAAKLRDEMNRIRIEERVKREAAAYDKLNKALAEANRLEKERNDLIAGRKAAERTLEDANDELAKQKEISALDPNAEDYKTRKAEIERTYADRASDRRAERVGEDTRSQASNLYGQADAKERDANALQAEADRRNRTFELARERSFQTGMKSRSGDEDDIKAHEEAQKAADAAYDAWKKVDEEVKKLRGEAQSLRNRAGEMAGSNLSANVRRDAEKQSSENAERERQAEEKRAADRKAKEEADKKAKEKHSVEDATLERQKQEDIAALNPGDKDYERQKREIERLYETRAAELKVERAKTPEEKRVAEEGLSAVMLSHDNDRREENAAEAKDRMSELSQFATRASSADMVSQNRLTAMGLGSGVKATGGVASDVKRIADLLKQEIAATKANKPNNTSSVATYAE